MYLGDNHYPLCPSLLIPAQRRLLGARRACHGRELFQALDVGGEGSLSVKEVALVDVRKQRPKNGTFEEVLLENRRNLCSPLITYWNNFYL